MRFYDIALTNAQTGEAVVPSSLGGAQGPKTITSLLPNGQFNPGALNVEMDIPVYPAHTGDAANSFIRIWGIGIQDIGSALNLTPNLKSQAPATNITVRGGMSKGLPLANPAQQGLLLQGAVFQAFGNWIGTNMSLDLVVGPSIGSPVNPSNFAFSWAAGTPLADAVTQTLKTALPSIKPNVQISSNLVLSHDEKGVYQSLKQFAQYVNEVSVSILGPQSRGVQIATRGDTVLVWDGSSQPTSGVKNIQFQDMLGQPTWIDPQTIMVKLVLRGDLNLQDIISIPPSIATTSAASFLRFQDKSAFTGNFQITQMHHWANFRQADAQSWNTTVWAATQSKEGATS